MDNLKAETITMQCVCGLFLRGTTERETRRPSVKADSVEFSVSCTMALCPNCGAVLSTPVEFHGTNDQNSYVTKEQAVQYLEERLSAKQPETLWDEIQELRASVDYEMSVEEALRRIRDAYDRLHAK